MDGVALEQYSVSSLRGRVGVVSQQPTLFNMSIADNIAIAASKHCKHSVDRKDVMNAAKAANAHDFIMKWPEVWLLLIIIK